MIIFYMLLRHPILFWKYTVRWESALFLVNGTAKDIETKGLRTGKKVRFGHDGRIEFYKLNDKLPNLVLGDNCHFGNRVTFLLGENIVVGNDCLFASDILVTSENHIVEPESKNNYKKLEGSIVSIGDNCWIGEKVVILPGVTIGKKCVIGAGSIVTSEIPEYSIAVGNPAHVIKKYDLEKHVWKKV